MRRTLGLTPRGSPGRREAVCFSVALVLGSITQHWKLSPIVGYLLAGVALGPQTPGFIADQETAAQFADIGIVLLMFGVGVHFDLRGQE